MKDEIQKRTVFLNGSYLPEDEAKISVFDRGFLLADAVYEYTAVIGGKLLEFGPHMDRLQNSLASLEFDYALDIEDVLQMHRELVKRNNIDVGGVYLQVSRGVAERDFAFPTGLTPTIMAFTQMINFLEHPANDSGLKVITVEDGRWARPDIKTVQLLYTAMAKSEANKRGAHDALFVKNGYITEATSANAFMVVGGSIVTHPKTHDILHGITRESIFSIADQLGLAIESRLFTAEEAQSADEVFMTASPLYVLGVTEIDGVVVGSGKPGLITQQLRTQFLENATAMAT